MATEENIRLTVRPMDGAAQSVTVTPGEGTVSPNFNLLPAPSSVSTPLFLSNQAEKHWDRLLPEQDAVYVQLYNVHDEQDESLPEYGKRLRRLLAEADPANLILDMRHNTGGATALYPELLRTIVGFSQRPGKQVYVIIGRATYSAAANLITDLERLADPIFLGEPSGQCCNFAGDPSPVLLPYSRISGAVSAVRWNLSGNVFEGRSEISPEVPVQLTARAYFAGEDPVVAAISHLIRRRESPGSVRAAAYPRPTGPSRSAQSAATSATDRPSRGALYMTRFSPGVQAARRIFEAVERERPQQPDPFLPPAEGQPVLRLATVGGPRRQPQVAPPGRPAQLLRLPRPRKPHR